MFVVIACGVFTASHHELSIVKFLGFVSDDVSFTLFGNGITNEAFLCFEVVDDLVSLVAVVAF